jgi:hypothetical protein
MRKMVQADPDLGWRTRYDAYGTEEVEARDGGLLPDRDAGEGDGRDQAVNVFRPADTAGA